MSWLARRSSTSVSTATPYQNPAAVSQPLIDLLNCIDAESIIISADELVIHESVGVASLHVIRDYRIINESMLLLLRAARRSGTEQEDTFELPRGPIGAGMHDLLVRAAPLGTDGLMVLLIFDDSELRRLDSIRRDFVANISHELKTPIGALSILSEAVLGASDDPEAITRFANRMQTEARRLSELVQEIINLSRLQDDDPMKHAEPFPIIDAVREAIDQSQLHAESRNIEIVFASECEEKVTGDRIQITMAIQNLIENAINYSPDKTRVAVALKSVNGLAEISISDQGIGIPEKDLERIFERFYRVDPARSRATGGTGLGLSIVKHIISNHGGDISVWSIEGAGSTFTIRIPLTSEVGK